MSTTVPTHTLTAAQLNGLACVDCGSTDTVQQPTGDRSPSGAQLFRCVDLPGCRAQQSIDAQFPLLAALRTEEQPPAPVAGLEDGPSLDELEERFLAAARSNPVLIEALTLASCGFDQYEREQHLTPGQARLAVAIRRVLVTLDGGTR